MSPSALLRLSVSFRTCVFVFIVQVENAVKMIRTDNHSEVLQ